MGHIKTNTLEGMEDWFNEPWSYDQAAQAIAFALEALRPEGEPTPPPRSHIMGSVSVFDDFDPVEALNGLGQGSMRHSLSTIMQPELCVTKQGKEIAAEIRDLLGPAFDRLEKYIARMRAEVGAALRMATANPET